MCSTAGDFEWWHSHLHLNMLVHHVKKLLVLKL
jgi:hypothetical protein